MTENRFEAFVGLVVLFLSAGFLYFLLQQDEILSVVGGYEISAKFSSAQGLSVGADVRLAGIKVGSVSGMALDSQDYLALVRLEIQQDVVIPLDSYAVITTDSLLGGHFVELVPGGAIEMLAAGDIIEDTQGYVSLTELLTNIFFER